MMHARHPLPIHHKLPLVTVLACILVITLASLAYLVHDVVSYHRLLREQLSSLAHVIGMNSTAALTFEDREVATRLLSALSSKRDVLCAATYDRHGNLFAAYASRGAEAPRLPDHCLHAPTDENREVMCVTETIALDQVQLGSVHLCATKRPLHARTFRFLLFVALVISSLTLLAVLVARWMLSRFMRPLEALTLTARHIAQDEDYSVRVRVENEQEVGELVTAFNMMLERIESSSVALKDSARRLRTHRERLRSLSQALQTAEERERHALAVAVHDSVCQTLCGLQMELSALAGRKDAGPAVVTALGEIKTLVGTAIQEARSLTTRLFPRGLQDLGLGAALAGLVAELKSKHNLQVLVHTRGPEMSLDFDTRILAFRCVQELLRNITKHAKAKTAWVDCETSAEGLQIQVRDNGVGFDPERVLGEHRTDGGFGLFSIIERVQAAGGRLDIDAAPGRGATMTVTLPHHEPPATIEG